jgi:hypothetical protein
MNKELERTIRYLKHLGLENRPNAEMAFLAGLDPKTVTRSKTAIKTYFINTPKPSAQDCLELDGRAASYFLRTNEGQGIRSFRELFGGLCGYLLVYRFGLLSNIKTSTQAIKAGRSFMGVALQILAYKDASKGVGIHSRNKSLRYMKTVSNKGTSIFDQLFQTDNSYKSGAYSKTYKLTCLADDIINELGGLLRVNLEQYVPLVNKHMKGIYPIVKVIPTSNPLICLPGNRTFTNPPEYMHLSTGDVLKLSLVSMLQVLNLVQLNSVGNPFTVTLKNLASTDEKLGRDYNIFTRLRSNERTNLGYFNYDLSSGIQIISFGILYKYSANPDLFEKYSLIFKYGWEADYKKEIRETIAQDLGKGVVEVKQLLTSYANGFSNQSAKSELLKQFHAESDALRRDVISIITQYKPGLLKAAVAQSKHSFPPELDWKDDSEDPELSREKASVFFFIWTHFEKQIRDAMLSVVNDGIPVHDAIYSKHKVPFPLFEQAVLNKTGFEVKIGS